MCVCVRERESRRGFSYGKAGIPRPRRMGEHAQPKRFEVEKDGVLVTVTYSHNRANRNDREPRKMAELPNEAERKDDAQRDQCGEDVVARRRGRDRLSGVVGAPNSRDPEAGEGGHLLADHDLEQWRYRGKAGCRGKRVGIQTGAVYS